MKKKMFNKVLIGLSFVMVAFVFIACEDSVFPGNDPDLTLKSLKIFEQSVDGSALAVENAKTEIKAENVVAKFDYGIQVDQQINVTVKNGNLREGQNIVTLFVPAVKGSYKSWT